MAKFKTHIGWGVFIGVGLVVFGLIYTLFSGIGSASWVFLAVITGSFLPDLDLDDGIPFQILFGLFGAAVAGLVFFDFYQDGERNLRILISFPVLAFLFVRFLIGYIFKRFTHHRGMLHSIPAAILFGLLTIWIFHLLSIARGQELIIGLSVAIGYFGHLVLDEIYSTVNLDGGLLFSKQSLGSAIKLYSSSRISTLLFYCLIIILTITLPETRRFF